MLPSTLIPKPAPKTRPRSVRTVLSLADCQLRKRCNTAIVYTDHTNASRATSSANIWRQNLLSWSAVIGWPLLSLCLPPAELIPRMFCMGVLQTIFAKSSVGFICFAYFPAWFLGFPNLFGSLRPSENGSLEILTSPSNTLG